DPRADNANCVSTFGMHNNQETLWACGRLPDDNKVFFVGRMQRVGDGQGQWVAKYGRRLFEGDAVPLDVLPGFLVVPLEGEAHLRSPRGAASAASRLTAPRTPSAPRRCSG